MRLILMTDLHLRDPEGPQGPRPMPSLSGRIWIGPLQSAPTRIVAVLPATWLVRARRAPIAG